MYYLYNYIPKIWKFRGYYVFGCAAAAVSAAAAHHACTGHNFVTNTPIKFIFAIAIDVPDYKNPMIFGINWKNKMASGGHFVYKCSKLVAPLNMS